MKFIVLVSVFLVSAVLVQGEESEADHASIKECFMKHKAEVKKACPLPENKECTEVWKGCAKKLNITIDTDEKDWVAIYHQAKGKCIAKCVSEDGNLVDNGAFSKDKAIEIIKKVASDRADEATKMFEECYSGDRKPIGPEECQPFNKGVMCILHGTMKPTRDCIKKKCDELK